MEKIISFQVIKRLFAEQNSIVFVSIAIFGRLIQVVFFYNIYVDASYQVLATDNFLHGHGFSTGEVPPTDLSQTAYTPLISWPPGYSWLLIPFYVLFHHNYIAAGIGLDIAAAVLLILFSRKVLKLFEVPASLINLFTLLTGFFIYQFYNACSSDSIAISFFVAGLFFALRLLKTNQQIVLNCISLGVSLFISGSIKYMLIPVVFLVPFYLFLKGAIEKNKILRRVGFLCSVALLIFLGGLVVYLKNVGGSYGYISSQGRGFFLQHLTETYPFLSASLLKPDTLLLFFKSISVRNVIYKFHQWLTLVLTIWIAVQLFKTVKRKKWKYFSLFEAFFLLSFTISLTITFLLMVLSLTVTKEEITPGFFWTYVQEPRYYGLVYVLVHLGIFIFFKYSRLSDRKRWKLLSVVLILLLLPDFFRGVVFDSKRIINFGKEEYSWQYENRLQKATNAVVEKIRAERRNMRVVVTGSSYYLNHRFCLFSHVPIMHQFNRLWSPTDIRSSSPVVLLIVIGDADLPFLKKSPLWSSMESVGNYEHLLYYALDVDWP